ncbi:MAG: stage III sporulation protein AE [Bacillota bacterium]|jgi:stage III sporulation protein AE
MLQKTLLCLSLMMLLFASPAAAVSPEVDGSDSIDQVLEQQLNDLDISQLQPFLDQLSAEYADYLPELSLRGLVQSLRQQEGLSAGQVLNMVLKLALRELAGQWTLLLRVLVLSLLCVLLQHLHEAVAGKVATIAYLICFLVIMGFALQSFGLALSVTREALTTMVSFVQALYPLLLTLLLAIGNVSSAALFSPMLLVVLTGITTLIGNLAVPLIFFSGVLILVNNLSETIKVSHLANLLRNVGAGLMGLLFMIFVGFNIAQSTLGSVADGVAFRAGKFAVKAFLPVVGSLLSDGFETIAGCSALISNSLGFIGCIGVVLYCTLPAVKLVGMLIIYRVAAALVQPIGGGRIANALNDISGVFTYFFGALALVGVLLFMLITVVVSTGNSALMLR